MVNALQIVDSEGVCVICNDRNIEPHRYLKNKHKWKNTDWCTDSMGVAGKMTPKDKALFWRIGAEKKRWWFDGTVLDVLSVVCPTGATATIVGIS